jgi:hypothetical protein
MAKRAMIVVACLALSALFLLPSQHQSSAQTAVQPPAPVAAPAPSNPRGFPLGDGCTVYLRGDATGMSVHDRVMDLSSLASVKGALEAGGDHWIVLKTDDGKHEWIPVEAVAAVVAEK